MSDAIRTFDKDSKEHKRLEAAAKLIEAETLKKCEVSSIFFDIDQGWIWTTISIESGMKTFPFVQALNPKQQKDIVYGDIETWMQAVTEVIESHSGR